MTAAEIDTLDLFAGPGGWSIAAAALGLREAGVELDPWACATRAAAGHLTVRADVSTLPTARMAGRIRGLIASPPCGTFSAAGKGEGIDDLPLLHQALDDLAAGRDTRAQLAASCSDPRTPLVVEPLRYALALRPQWIALEQVPAVLPLWRHIARLLRAVGYSAWAGVLNAADYGVPQTRKRAILIASRVRTVAPPQPTHAKVAEPESLFGPGRERWVSMAQALGWSPALATGVVNTRGERSTPGGNEFSPTGPSWALTEKTRSWVVRTNSGNGYAHDYERDIGEASPSITSRTGRWKVVPGAGGFAQGYERDCEEPSPTIRQQAQSWVLRSGQSVAGEGRAERGLGEPAVSITGRADLCSWGLRNNTQTNAAVRSLDEPAGTLFFGHPRDVVAPVPEEQGPGGQEPVRITIQEAAALQSFPADYPWQGTKTQAFLQCGNAVPPLLAAHVLSAASGVPFTAATQPADGFGLIRNDTHQQATTALACGDTERAA